MDVDKPGCVLNRLQQGVLAFDGRERVVVAQSIARLFGQVAAGIEGNGVELDKVLRRDERSALAEGEVDAVLAAKFRKVHLPDDYVQAAYWRQSVRV
jgi:hypothetical protein